MSAYADFVLQIFYTLEKLKSLHSVYKDHWNLCYNIESKSALFISLMECNGINTETSEMQKKLEFCHQKLHQIESEVFHLTQMHAIELFNRKYFLDYINNEMKYEELDDLKRDNILLVMKLTSKTNLKFSQILDLYIKYIDTQRLIKTLKAYYSEKQHLSAQFHPLSSETGRISTSSPNLQGIPKNINNINLRNFFVPNEGYLYLDIDFSQMELCIATYLSQSSKLSNILKDNIDIHGVVTSLLFNIPYVQACDKENTLYDSRRKEAKNIVFSILYGADQKDLAKRLKDIGIEIGKIDAILNQLEDYFSEIKLWQNNVIAECKKNLSITTHSRKKIYIPEINSIYSHIKANGKRRAINNIVQGTSSEYFKIFLIRLYEKFNKNPNIRPVLTIHDEVLLEVKEESLLPIAKEIKELASIPPFSDYTLPIKFALSYGANFGDLIPLNI